MLATLHHRQRCVNPFGKGGYGFIRRQPIPLTVQDAGRDAPAYGVAAHIAQVVPGQGLTEVRGDLTALLQLRLRDLRPAHHIGDELLHVHHRGNEQGVIHQFFI